MRLICCSDKARRLMGWQPRTDLRRGLQRTIDYIRGHPHAYKTDHYNV